MRNQTGEKEGYGTHYEKSADCATEVSKILNLVMHEVFYLYECFELYSVVQRKMLEIKIILGLF